MTVQIGDQSLAFDLTGATTPQVVGLANGKFLAAWVQANGTLAYRMVGADGITQASGSHAYVMDRPFELVATASGAAVLYSGHGPGGHGTRLLTFNTEGQAASQSILLQATPANQTIANVQLTVLADGRIAAGWARGPTGQPPAMNGGTYHNHVAIIDPVTGTATPPVAAATNDALSLRLSDIFLSAEGFAIAYTNSRRASDGLAIQHFNAQGSVAGSPIILGVGNDNGKIVSLEGGGFAVSWNSFTGFNNSPQYLQTFSATGTAQTSQITLVAIGRFGGQQGFQSGDIVKLDDGRFMVVFSAYSTSDHLSYDTDVYGQVFAANGQPITPIIPLAAGVASFQSTPTISVRGDGHVVLTYLRQESLSGPATAHVIVIATDDAPITTGGTAGNDALIGRTGDDRLEGLAGNDILDGRYGDDALNGGIGADQLYGMDGNDDIDGGADLDADILVGGPGNDNYIWRSFDQIYENAGEGIDRVTSHDSYYLHANIENLSVGGAGNWYGVGNDLANTITGNSGANLLLGGAGNDTVRGGAGNDQLYGEAGVDTMFGEAGIDYLIGGAGNDVLDGGTESDGLYGEDGDDTLIGGSGFFSDILDGGSGNDILRGDSGLGEQDHLNGGAGNDSYYVDSYADLTYEALGGGTDTVYATINGTGYYLYANVENLTLGGDTPFGVGNELANRLTGSAAANWLLGGGGNDTLNGKTGNDVLFGEGGADVFVFERGTGTDTVGDFAVGTDKINLAALGFTSFAQVMAATGDNGGTSFINLGGGDFVVLNGVTKASLGAGDFILSGGSGAVALLSATDMLAASESIESGRADWWALADAGRPWGHRAMLWDSWASGMEPDF